MKRLIFALILAISVFTAFAQPVFSQTDECFGSSAVLKNLCVEEDNRVQTLRNFLKKYNSPLVPYTQEFVDAADSYGVDWRLLPAISGVESTFGKQIPAGSFNAYGWNNGDFKFTSWEDSIWYVTSQLRTRYIDRGATTIPQIGRIYAASPFWPGKVTLFMAKIDRFSNFTLDL